MRRESLRFRDKVPLLSLFPDGHTVAFMTDVPYTPESFGEKIAQLSYNEPWWRDQSQILESLGYRLRPRYQPGWVASWTKTGENYWQCEDHVVNMVSIVVSWKQIKSSSAFSLIRHCASCTDTNMPCSPSVVAATAV